MAWFRPWRDVMDITSSSPWTTVQVELRALNPWPFRVTELQVVWKTPCSLYLWNYNRNEQRWKSYTQSKEIECLITEPLAQQEKKPTSKTSKTHSGSSFASKSISFFESLLAETALENLYIERRTKNYKQKKKSLYFLWFTCFMVHRGHCTVSRTISPIS